MQRWKEKMTERRFGKTMLLLVLILLIQGGMMLYFGNLKQGFHEDESYSFLMSNWSGWTAGSSAYTNEWKDASFFSDMLSVSGDELLDMEVVAKNYKSDNHPPLFGYILKFFSTLFTGTFTKWIGLIPNFAVSLAITVMVYGISRTITKDAGAALITAAAWAFSVGAMSAFVFIRMYVYQLLACMLLLFLHFRYRRRFLSGRVPYSVCIGLYICTVAAILTHYYSLVFCFFLCGCYLLEILANRKWKSAAVYAVSQLLAVGTAAVVWPLMMDHLFTGTRGAEAVGNLLSSSGEYWKHLSSVIHKLDLRLMGGLGSYILPAGFVLLAAFALRFHLSRKKRTEGITAIMKRNADELSPMLICALLVVGYVLLTVKAAPYQSGRYYKCIYPVVLIVLFSGYHAVLSRLISRAASRMVLTALVIAMVVSGYSVQTVNYLNLSPGRQEAIDQHAHLPAIVLNNAGYNSKVFQWLAEYPAYEQVFIARKGETYAISDAAEAKDLSEGFLLYAIAFDEKDDVLMEEIGEHVDIVHFERVFSDDDCDLYVVKLNASNETQIQ